MADKIEFDAAVCLSCGDIVFSRVPGDLRKCSCGRIQTEYVWNFPDLVATCFVFDRLSYLQESPSLAYRLLRLAYSQTKPIVIFDRTYGVESVLSLDYRLSIFNAHYDKYGEVGNGVGMEIIRSTERLPRITPYGVLDFAVNTSGKGEKEVRRSKRKKNAYLVGKSGWLGEGKIMWNGTTSSEYTAGNIVFDQLTGQKGELIENE
jgi:hypothetical protein